MVPQRIKGTKIHKDLIYNILKLSEFLVFLCLSGKNLLIKVDSMLTY